MFAPSQQDVRRFFCETWRRLHTGLPLDPMQAKAAEWVRQHPEYDGDLADEAAALDAVYTVEEGRTNPFLHLSMHLSLVEQVDIDQPRGIRPAFEALRDRLGSAHEAHHQMMECLGEMIWASQRNGTPMDGAGYVEAVRMRAGR